MVRNTLRGSFTKWPGNINVDATYLVCAFTSFSWHTCSADNMSAMWCNILCVRSRLKPTLSSGHETLQAAFNSLQLFRLFYEQLPCQCYAGNKPFFLPLNMSRSSMASGSMVALHLTCSGPNWRGLYRRACLGCQIVLRPPSFAAESHVMQSHRDPYPHACKPYLIMSLICVPTVQLRDPCPLQPRLSLMRWLVIRVRLPLPWHPWTHVCQPYLTSCFIPFNAL